MDSPSRLKLFFSRWRGRNLASALLLLSFSTVALALLTLAPAVTKATKHALGDSSLLRKINEHLNPFRTRHALYQSGLPIYDLKITPAEYREVLQVVDEATRRGKLTDDLKQWSKARFVYEGVSRNVKIRVRGDNLNHWGHERRSWRILFPKDEPFQGQREINLIVTTDGKGITEHFTNAVFGRLGLVTLRGGYVILRINGIPQGVYYLVEHFDAPLLAHHRRPESTILSNPRHGFDPASFREQITDGDPQSWPALQKLLNYEVNSTGENFEAACAVTDMNDFLRWTAGTALFCADHSSLHTDNHRLYYDTSVGLFYRIPWDLEPTRIPNVERFDLADWHATFDVFARWPMSKFRVAVLQKPSYMLERNRILWDLVRDNSLLELFDETYRDVGFSLWSDVMGQGDEEARLWAFRDLVGRNAKKIRTSLAHKQAELTVHQAESGRAVLRFAVNGMGGLIMRGLRLDVSMTEGGNGAMASDTALDLSTMGPFPSRLAADSSGFEPRPALLTRYSLFRDADDNGALDGADPLVAEASVDVDGRVAFPPLAEWMPPSTGVAEDFPAYIFDSQIGGYRTKPLRTVVYPRTSYVTYFLTRTPECEAKWPSVHVDAVNAVTGEAFVGQDLNIRAYATTTPYDPTLRHRSLTKFLDRHPQFIRQTEEGGDDIQPGVRESGTVVLTAGRHLLEGTIVVPHGVTLVIEPGATLTMGKSAALLCFGPIRAEGRADAPIRIEPASSEPWTTLAAVQPGGPCHFRYVYVTGGTAGVVEGVFFTGVVAIHGGDAVIDRCRFTECPGEDAVNVKNGAAIIRDSYFADNESDALDLDFVSGEVRGCHFVHNLGDAVDLSGSQATVRGNRMEGCGDKGISVGESSTAEIVDNLLIHNAIGIAVKDLSQARIDHCTLVGNTRSITAYRKKPIFGGGEAFVRSTIILESDEPVSTDELSTVRLTDCIAPIRARLAGAAPAPARLSSQLRSQRFVFYADRATTDSNGADAAADGVRPGILAPPVDLR